MEEITNFKPDLHVFICINERIEGPTPSCCPTITPEMVKEVKQWLIKQGLAGRVYCTKAKCLGFCNPDGGVMCIWPSGRFVKGLRSVGDIQQIIMEEVDKL